MDPNPKGAFIFLMEIYGQQREDINPLGYGVDYLMEGICLKKSHSILGMVSQL